MAVAAPVRAFLSRMTDVKPRPQVARRALDLRLARPVATQPPADVVRRVREQLQVEVEPALLADDDEVQRKLSVFKLARLGFEVVDAADGPHEPGV